MEKLRYVVREAAYMVWRHKFYFLLPILVALAVLTVLAYHIGPTVAISFIYTGL